MTRKGILNLEKITYFKKHLLIKVQQNILPRTMEWWRGATNVLEQEDSLLNIKGPNNSFLNYNRFFSHVYRKLLTLCEIIISSITKTVRPAGVFSNLLPFLEHPVFFSKCS